MLKEVVGRAGGVGCGSNLQEWLLEQDPEAAGPVMEVMGQEAATRILALKNVPSERTTHRTEERIGKPCVG